MKTPSPHRPRVSIVLLTCNRNDDTRACIQSLQQTGESCEIILVDNGTQPNPAPEFEREFPDVVFLRNEENLGTPIGNNIGIRHALDHGADFVMMLNNDTTVDKNFLRPLVDAMDADPGIGIAGGKIYYYSEPTRIWFAGGRYNSLTCRVEHLGILKYDHEVPARPAAEVDFISGCFSLFRSSALRAVGLLDEQFFAYMEDVDLNVRIKNAGYSLAYIPESFIYHKVSTTIKVDSPFFLYFNMRNRILMLKKHNPRFRQLLAIPYLTFFFSRQLIRLSLKLRYWKGVKSVLYGIQDGLRNHTGRLGMGRLRELQSP
jgi:GT2 family glycosyltransferase